MKLLSQMMIRIVSVGLAALLMSLFMTPPQLKPQVKQLINAKTQLKAPKNLVRQIQRNHPGLTPDYTNNLAATFEQVSKRYKLPANRLSAMAMQESGYVLDAKQCYELNSEIRCDYCMMQINDHTIQSYGFDVQKLMTDLDYCVDAGAKVLSDFKKQYGKTDKDFWTRYNAVSTERRHVYKRLVERFM